MLATGFVATRSVAQTAGCAGELTVQNFGAPECIGRIAVPTPRPDPQAAALSGKQDRVATAAPVYIETPAPGGQGTRRVRLVGPRFLPDDGARYDLHRPVTFASDPLNATAFEIISLLMPHTSPEDAGTAVARKADEKPVLEARANLAARMAAN
jgi:hypothetical protein